MMQTKSILLFGEMLEAINFPARKELVHFMAAGFPMSGLYPLTHVFPQKTREQVLPAKDLWRTAKERQSWATLRVRGCGDSDLDREIIDGTWD